MNRKLFSLSLIFVLVGLSHSDERAEYIRSHYTKFEYRIPMRDGARLFTAVYAPNDRSKTYPFLLLRTPYSVAPYGADQYRAGLAPHHEFEKEGFIFVFQDVRGKFMSEGEYVQVRPHNPNKQTNQDIDENSDTYDTIEWLLAHIPNHNGRVGQLGVSYPGFYTSAGAIDSHPALKASSPQAPVTDWFWDDFHFHGAFSVWPAFGFFAINGQKRESPHTEWPKASFDMQPGDLYRFFLDLGPLKNVNDNYFKGEIEFWNEFIRHPNYDEFWKARNILPHLKNIKSAVMVVGGWFDSEDLYGPLKTYRAIEKQNPSIFNMLVMGPWNHGGWSGAGGQALSDAEFGFSTSGYYQENLDFKFFKHFLKQPEEELDFPEAVIFETGSNRWRTFDTWPPAGIERNHLYINRDEALSFDPPTDSEPAADSYISDPKRPVPHSRHINTEWWAGPYRPESFLADDQRFAAQRPDVLVYQTEPLEDDITLAGPMTANLFVSTTGTDSDWVVKLIDAHPNDIPEKRGQQILVRSQAFRGRFRESFENPKPFEPGEITKVSFEILDVLHTFKRGHRIMVHIQSSWFPYIDRNPQKFVPNIFEAEEADFIVVTNSVHRSQQYPSSIEIGVLKQLF